MDGAEAQFETSWEDGDRFLVARIGDPDVYLYPGEHTYTITYAIDGVISDPAAGAAGTYASPEGQDASDPGSVLYWNVVAQGWEMAIRTGAHRDLPAQPQRRRSSARPGRRGSRALRHRGRRHDGPGPDRRGPATADRDDRACHDGPPAPDRPGLPWSVRWDPILGRSVGAVIAGPRPGGRCAGGWDRLGAHRPGGVPRVPRPVRAPGGPGPGPDRRTWPPSRTGRRPWWPRSCTWPTGGSCRWRTPVWTRGGSSVGRRTRSGASWTRAPRRWATPWASAPRGELRGRRIHRGRQDPAARRTKALPRRWTAGPPAPGWCTWRPTSTSGGSPGWWPCSSPRSGSPAWAGRRCGACPSPRSRSAA